MSYNIENLENINTKDKKAILNVWENSVKSTHKFLSDNDIKNIKPQVEYALDKVTNLLCIRDDKNTIQAFIGVYNSKIEMLFINDGFRKRGFGKALIENSKNILNVKFVDVNEQNIEATGFYKHMGFNIFDRSEFDEQGNHFPILHMKL